MTIMDSMRLVFSNYKSSKAIGKISLLHKNYDQLEKERETSYFLTQVLQPLDKANFNSDRAKEGLALMLNKYLPQCDENFVKIIENESVKFKNIQSKLKLFLNQIKKFNARLNKEIENIKQNPQFRKQNLVMKGIVHFHAAQKKFEEKINQCQMMPDKRNILVSREWQECLEAQQDYIIKAAKLEDLLILKTFMNNEIKNLLNDVKQYCSQLETLIPASHNKVDPKKNDAFMEDCEFEILKDLFFKNIDFMNKALRKKFSSQDCSKKEIYMFFKGMKELLPNSEQDSPEECLLYEKTIENYLDNDFLLFLELNFKNKNKKYFHKLLQKLTNNKNADIKELYENTKGYLIDIEAAKGFNFVQKVQMKAQVIGLYAYLYAKKTNNKVLSTLIRISF